MRTIIQMTIIPELSLIHVNLSVTRPMTGVQMSVTLSNLS